MTVDGSTLAQDGFLDILKLSQTTRCR
jgi:hypothetical protein